MTLVRTFNVGSLRCHTLEGGLQRLDGGAMFGVVPRPLWEKAIAPDERHRIPLAMRCLLVEHPDGLVLIDTALGGKEDAKFKDIYGIENESGRAATASPRSDAAGAVSGDGLAAGRTQLDDALEAAGYAHADVRWVINTHLHFDHAGGNTRRDPAEVGHDGGVRRGPHPDVRPSPASLDHGLRPRAAPHTREQARHSPRGGQRGVADRVRARCGGGVGDSGAHGDGGGTRGNGAGGLTMCACRGASAGRD